MRWLVRTLWLVLISAICCASSFAQPITITLKDSNRGETRIDSADLQEAWIELVAGSPNDKALTPQDLIVTLGDRHAEILTVDSVASKFRSQLALSVVLDNSGSMFHAYDSLTKYCDSLVDSLPLGVKYQAVTFDKLLRTPTHRPTFREKLYIAQSGFRDSARSIKSYWHDFDSIRAQYTPLYDAIATALQNVDGRRLLTQDSLVDVLLVVTDGEDNASRTALQSLRELLDASRVRFYAVNYRTEDTRLEWLVSHTGGQYYLAESLKDLRELLRGIRQLLSRQYHVRYRFPALGPSGSGVR